LKKVKNNRMHRTYVAKPGEVERMWYVVDAADQTLGRLATRIATILRGKHKPEYTPHEDVGDFVVIVNADKVRVTGRKLDQKMYYRHTGYPGGIREISLRRQLEEHPERVIYRAVKGMLPRGPLGRSQLKKLKIYAGAQHPHEAQQPQALEL
jgi:large subunit ribosomal protein L13